MMACDSGLPREVAGISGAAIDEGTSKRSCGLWSLFLY